MYNILGKAGKVCCQSAHACNSVTKACWESDTTQLDRSIDCWVLTLMPRQPQRLYHSKTTKKDTKVCHQYEHVCNSTTRAGWEVSQHVLEKAGTRTHTPAIQWQKPVESLTTRIGKESLASGHTRTPAIQRQRLVESQERNRKRQGMSVIRTRTPANSVTNAGWASRKTRKGKESLGAHTQDTTNGGWEYESHIVTTQLEKARKVWYQDAHFCNSTTEASWASQHKLEKARKVWYKVNK